ncbi:MAG: nitrous oxide-stimulated promoter family protein [Lysobacterales bacterium]|jgi:hypothetical protein
MEQLNGRLKREHDTLECMTRIYCAQHHAVAGEASLCPDCRQLVDYAFQRLLRCPFGAEKPTCANCPVHCYKPARREEVRKIMRFSGPRMSWRHPVKAFLHVLDKSRRAEHPRVARLRASRRGK